MAGKQGLACPTQPWRSQEQGASAPRRHCRRNSLRRRGISIHHQECANVRRFTGEKGRKIPLHWEGETGERYEVILEIRAQDRHRLLADITTEIATTGTNIVGSRTQADGNRAQLHFTVEVIDIKHLNRIVSRLVGIDGVKSVSRRKRVI